MERSRVEARWSHFCLGQQKVVTKLRRSGRRDPDPLYFPFKRDT
jgi:hypothetical protein